MGWGGGKLKLALRAVLEQIQRLKEGFVRRSLEGRYYRLLRLLNGALLVSQGPGDNAVTLWGGFLHLLNTKLHFGLWSDKICRSAASFCCIELYGQN